MPSMAEKGQAGGDSRHRAACLKEDPELFFPIGKTGPALEQIEAAKAVCAGCPMLEECRAYALAHPSLTEHGVWGGLSEDERTAERAAELRRLRRLRRRRGASGVAA